MSELVTRAWEHLLTGVVRQLHDKPSQSSLDAGDYDPLVRASEAADRIEALEAEVEIANRNRVAGRDNFHAMQQAAYKLAQKLEAAEARATTAENEREQLLAWFDGLTPNEMHEAIKRDKARIAVLEKALFDLREAVICEIDTDNRSTAFQTRLDAARTSLEQRLRDAGVET